MKKFLTSLLLFLYMSSSAGVTIHLHYCMGEFAGWSLTDTNEGTCSKCGMEKHSKGNTCCDDVQVTKKVSDEHASAKCNVICANAFEIEPPSYCVVYTAPVYAEPTYRHPQKFPPPGSTPLIVKLRNLRI